MRAGATAKDAAGEGSAGGGGENIDETALLSLTVGVEETSVNIAIGALRDALDLTSHIAMLHTRRHACEQTRLDPSCLRPRNIAYHGHAKEWWQYACACARAGVKRRRCMWRASSISKALEIGRAYRDIFRQVLLQVNPRIFSLVLDSVCVCVFVCVCICMCVYKYTHIYLCIYICIYTK